MAWSRYTTVVPKDAATTLNLAVEGIGTGPFKLGTYTPNKEVTYARNPDFWIKGRPYVDEMTYQVITDEDARIAALRSGAIDGCDVSALGARRLESESSITIYKGLFAQPKVLQMTLRGDKPWDKKEVRQAINKAINRQELIDKVAEGEAVLTGPVVPGYGDWPLPDARLQELYTFDLDGAKQLMQQAGVADGFSVTALTFTGYANDNAVVVQEQLKQLNIDMKIEQIEFGTFAQRVSNGEFEWVFTARGMRADVSGFVNDFRRLGIAADKWFPAWKNEEFEKAYDDGMATLDQAARKPFFDKVQELTIEESPHIYLYQDYRFSAVSNKVKDYYVAFTTFHPSLREVWIDA
jgi:peptide/nickel transport system substrate-binding protein